MSDNNGTNANVGSNNSSSVSGNVSGGSENWSILILKMLEKCAPRSFSAGSSSAPAKESIRNFAKLYFAKKPQLNPDEINLLLFGQTLNNKAVRGLFELCGIVGSLNDLKGSAFLALELLLMLLDQSVNGVVAAEQFWNVITSAATNNNNQPKLTLSLLQSIKLDKHILASIPTALPTSPSNTNHSSNLLPIIKPKVDYPYKLIFLLQTYVPSIQHKDYLTPETLIKYDSFIQQQMKAARESVNNNESDDQEELGDGKSSWLTHQKNQNKPIEKEEDRVLKRWNDIKPEDLLTSTLTSTASINTTNNANKKTSQVPNSSDGDDGLDELIAESEAEAATFEAEGETDPLGIRRNIRLDQEEENNQIKSEKSVEQLNQQLQTNNKFLPTRLGALAGQQVKLLWQQLTHLSDDQQQKQIVNGKIVKNQKSSNNNISSNSNNSNNLNVNTGVGEGLMKSVVMSGSILTGRSDFHPLLFLSRVHSSTSLSDLRRGLNNLSASISSRTDLSRELVERHFGEYVYCKDTIDHLHLLLQSEVREKTSRNYKIQQSIESLTQITNSTYTPILNSTSDTAKIRSALSTLANYRLLFSLPGEIRKSIQVKDQQNIIKIYNKIKTFQIQYQDINNNQVMQTNNHPKLSNPNSFASSSSSSPSSSSSSSLSSLSASSFLSLVLLEITRMLNSYRSSLLDVLSTTGLDLGTVERSIESLRQLDSPIDPLLFYINRMREQIGQSMEMEMNKFIRVMQTKYLSVSNEKKHSNKNLQFVKQQIIQEEIEQDHNDSYNTSQLYMVDDMEKMNGAESSHSPVLSTTISNRLIILIRQLSSIMDKSLPPFISLLNKKISESQEEEKSIKLQLQVQKSGQTNVTNSTSSINTINNPPIVSRAEIDDFSVDGGRKEFSVSKVGRRLIRSIILQYSSYVRIALFYLPFIKLTPNQTHPNYSNSLSIQSIIESLISNQLVNQSVLQNKLPRNPANTTDHNNQNISRTLVAQINKHGPAITKSQSVTSTPSSISRGEEQTVNPSSSPLSSSSSSSTTSSSILSLSPVELYSSNSSLLNAISEEAFVLNISPKWSPTSLPLLSPPVISSDQFNSGTLSIFSRSHYLNTTGLSNSFLSPYSFILPCSYPPCIRRVFQLTFNVKHLFGLSRSSKVTLSLLRRDTAVFFTQQLIAEAILSVQILGKEEDWKEISTAEVKQQQIQQNYNKQWKYNNSDLNREGVSIQYQPSHPTNLISFFNLEIHVNRYLATVISFNAKIKPLNNLTHSSSTDKSSAIPVVSDPPPILTSLPYRFHHIFACTMKSLSSFDPIQSIWITKLILRPLLSLLESFLDTLHTMAMELTVHECQVNEDDNKHGNSNLTNSTEHDSERNSSLNSISRRYLLLLSNLVYSRNLMFPLLLHQIQAILPFPLSSSIQDYYNRQIMSAIQTLEIIVVQRYLSRQINSIKKKYEISIFQQGIDWTTLKPPQQLLIINQQHNNNTLTDLSSLTFCPPIRSIIYTLLFDVLFIHSAIFELHRESIPYLLNLLIEGLANFLFSSIYSLPINLTCSSCQLLAAEIEFLSSVFQTYSTSIIDGIFESTKQELEDRYIRSVKELQGEREEISSSDFSNLLMAADQARQYQVEIALSSTRLITIPLKQETKYRGQNMKKKNQTKQGSNTTNHFKNTKSNDYDKKKIAQEIGGNEHPSNVNHDNEYEQDITEDNNDNEDIDDAEDDYYSSSDN